METFCKEFPVNIIYAPVRFMLSSVCVCCLFEFRITFVVIFFINLSWNFILAEILQIHAYTLPYSKVFVMKRIFICRFKRILTFQFLSMTQGHMISNYLLMEVYCELLANLKLK